MSLLLLFRPATGGGGGYDPALDAGNREFDPQLQLPIGPTWFAPDASVEGLPPLSSAPATAFAQGLTGWDAQQDRDLTVTWFAPEAEAQVIQPPAAAGFDPATMPQGWDAQQDVSRTERWLQLDPEALVRAPVAPPPFDPSAGFDWSEQPQEWRLTRWAAVDDDGSPQPLVPPPVQRWYFTDLRFNADHFAGDASRRATLDRPFGPMQVSSTPVTQSFWNETGTGFAYRFYFPPLTGPGGADPGPGVQLIRTPLWFGLWVDTDIRADNDWAFVDLIVEDPNFPNTYSFRAQKTQEFSVGGRTLYIFHAGDLGGDPYIQWTRDSRLSIEFEIWSTGGATQTFSFNSATAGVDGDSWIGFLDPLTPLPLVAQTEQDVSGQDLRDQTQRWYQPEDATEPLATGSPAVDVSPYPLWGWDAQQDRSTGQTWFAPDAEASVASQLANAWTGSPIGWDAVQDVDTGQRWFRPDDPLEGLVPIVPPLDPAILAELWPDQSGQQDRGIQPTWFRPDDPSEGIPPKAVTTATVAQQAALWPWDAQLDRDLRERWYSPNNHDPEGQAAVLNSYVWSPPAGGTAPAVLIDVDTGDVFLYLGSNFIAKAG